MKIGTFVEWNLTQFHGVDLPPLRGWIVAAEGDWFVVRCSSMKHPQSPFATFHRNELTPVPEVELVQRGATLLA